MNRLGYKIPQRGVCAGLICLVAFAEICEDEDKFERRIELINDLAAQKIRYKDTTDVKEILVFIRDKVKRHQKLTRFEKNVLDLDAFFSSIVLSHDTDKYKDLFDGFVAKADIVKLAEVIRPEKLAARGGIKAVYTEPFIGNERKLKKYLAQLSDIFSEYEKNAQSVKNSKLSISLYSPLHRIRIKYIPEEQNWTLTDPNQLPTRTIQQDQIAHEIIKAFHDTKITAFEAQIYAAGKNPLLEQIKSRLEQLKQSHKLKKETVKTATLKSDVYSGGTTIAHIAAMNGDVATLKKIAKLDKKSLFREDNDGYTPMFYAAQYGYDAVVEYLASLKESELIRVTNLGISPLSIATQMEHTNVLNVLQKHLELLHDWPVDSESPIFIAARNLKYNSLFSLADLDKELLSMSNEKGETAVHLMVRRGVGMDILVRLVAYNIDFAHSSHQETTPLSIAINDSRWDLVMVMMLHIPASSIHINKQVNFKLIKSELCKYLDNLKSPEQRDEVISSIEKRTNVLGQLIFDESKSFAKSNHGLFKAQQLSFKEFIFDLKSRFLTENKEKQELQK